MRTAGDRCSMSSLHKAELAEECPNFIFHGSVRLVNLVNVHQNEEKQYLLIMREDYRNLPPEL